MKGILGRLGLALMLSTLAGGCAKPAQVQSDALPVTRVVVYRNGVAYFERSGEVHDERVGFQLRQENVGDFLATLAIMERGGHSVRAASFPVSLAEQEEAEVDPELQRALDAWERKKRDPRQLREVTLELDGDRHDLTVGYLAETPLWRPSYRLVVGDDGAASLQVWGIVQNQSGEDWNDVEVALVAGAPIAFASNIGDPVIPARPMVTDRGEVISAVPQDAVSYHRVDESEDTFEEADGSMADYAAEMEAPAAIAKSASGASARKSSPAPKRSAAPRPMSAAPRDTSRLAQIEVQSGATRYEVPNRVTIPDESATMVLLVSKKVPGEAVHLYAPDGGVPDSYRHPFRVVRFKNESGGLLEKGPIAVFEDGAFLGQGLMSSLPVKAEATVPFALVRDLAIESSNRYDQRGARFYSVRSGNLYIERQHTSITTYEIQSGDQQDVKLLIKHPRSADSELYQPPQGTEDNVAEGAAYVPAKVPKFGSAKVVVEERRPVQTSVGWESVDARRAITEFVGSGKATEEQQKKLEEILKQAQELAKLGDQERKLRREQSELEKSTRETRLSLKAIEKNRGAAQLRAELTKRLSTATKRLEEITRELVELGLRRAEAEVRLKEARQALEIPPQDD